MDANNPSLWFSREQAVRKQNNLKPSRPLFPPNDGNKRSLTHQLPSFGISGNGHHKKRIFEYPRQKHRTQSFDKSDDWINHNNIWMRSLGRPPKECIFFCPTLRFEKSSGLTRAIMFWVDLRISLFFNSNNWMLSLSGFRERRQGCPKKLCRAFLVRCLQSPVWFFPVFGKVADPPHYSPELRHTRYRG